MLEYLKFYLKIVNNAFYKKSCWIKKITMNKSSDKFPIKKCTSTFRGCASGACWDDIPMLVNGHFGKCL